MTIETSESPIYGLMAEFDSAQELVAAAHKTHAAGYQKIDAYSPFPIEALPRPSVFIRTACLSSCLSADLLVGYRRTRCSIGWR